MLLFTFGSARASRRPENQRRELEEAARHRGWNIVATYADDGISGAKGRDKRPGLDAMLKDATRRRFDVGALTVSAAHSLT